LAAVVSLHGLPLVGPEVFETRMAAASSSIANTVDHLESYPQDSSQDDLVLSVVLAKSCASPDLAVLSSDPADPSDDTTEHDGPFKEAKAAMLRRSPNYFGASEQRGIDHIRLPARCPGLVLASEAAIQAALTGPRHGPTFKDWGNFASQFPGATAVRRVSLPGYSRDGQYAVVYSSGTCGRLCGSGFSVTLKRTKSGWTVVDAKMAWIS
jgi:hypothetical protein